MRPFLILLALMVSACGATDEREGGAEQRALNEAAAELDAQTTPPPKLTEQR